jgi:hypothetical protein
MVNRGDKGTGENQMVGRASFLFVKLAGATPASA